MAIYTYVTANMLTGQVVEEVPFGAVSFSRVLNGTGEFKGSIHTDHPKAARDVILPGARFLYVLRNGYPVWAGIIWAAKNQQGKLEVTAQEIASYFGKRRIKSTLTFTQQDQLLIARTLVNTMQAVPNGNLGIVVGSETSGVLRDRTYDAFERKPYGEALDQLAAVDNGFDWSIETTLSGSTFTNTLRLYYPRQGSRTSLTWDVGRQAFVDSWIVDASGIANSLDALGSGDGNLALIAPAADPSQLATYPLYEDTVSFKDVTVPATLAAHANAQLQRRSKAKAMPAVSVGLTPETELGTFIVGDEVQLRGNRGWTELDSWYRITAYEVTVTDEGDESVKVEMVDTEMVPQ